MYAHNVRACTLYVGQQVCACLHPVRGVYPEDEYVRACTLYVGQQVCSCLHPVRGMHPVRGIVPVSHLFTKLANYSPSQQRRARQPTYPDV